MQLALAQPYIELALRRYYTSYFYLQTMIGWNSKCSLNLRIFGFECLSISGIDEFAVNLQLLWTRQECLCFHRQLLFWIMG
jgi:hypothetical protein